MKLSIVIPVYNEEGTARAVIEKVKSLPLPLEKEIIVVDDGSKDGSFDSIRDIKDIKLMKHSINRGKGAAVKTALSVATGDYFVIQDADLELEPSQIANLIKPILEKNAEVVYGSRNLNKPDEKRSPLFYFGGLLITFVTNSLFGTKLTDEPCGFKLFKTSILRNIEIKNDRFEWEPEITAKIARRGIKIHEVSVSASSRSIGEGKKLRRRDGIKALLTLMKYRFFR